MQLIKCEQTSGHKNIWGSWLQTLYYYYIQINSRSSAISSYTSEPKASYCPVPWTSPQQVCWFSCPAIIYLPWWSPWQAREHSRSFTFPCKRLKVQISKPIFNLCFGNWLFFIWVGRLLGLILNFIRIFRSIVSLPSKTVSAENIKS